MEGQLFAFTTLPLMLKEEKLWGWWIQKKMRWDLTFVKRNPFVMYRFGVDLWQWNQVWDSFLCKAARNITNFLVADCVVYLGIGLNVTNYFSFLGLTPYEIHGKIS